MAATPSPKPASTPPSDIKEYVVLAGAAVLRVGKAKDEVQRFNRGSRLRLHSTEQRVKDMVRQGTLGIRGEKHVRATPASVMARMGAEDDPASPPIQEHLPVAPDPTADPVTV